MVFPDLLSGGAEIPRHHVSLCNCCESIGVQLDNNTMSPSYTMRTHRNERKSCAAILSLRWIGGRNVLVHVSTYNLCRSTDPFSEAKRSLFDD